jgi:PAS domain S-box-containing protein
MLAESIFKALFETLPDGVVIVNKSGRIEFVNAQAEALFGYERAELIDQPVEMLVPAEERAGHVAHRDRFLHSAGVRPMGVGLELFGERNDGSRFPIEISLSSLVRGAETYIIAAVRDVTERNRLRAQVSAQEDRQRIAMDLHDGVIQSIYATGLALDLALGEIVADPVSAGRRIDTSVARLGGVIEDIRAYIFDLRAARSTGDVLQDLVETIEEYRASSTLAVVFVPPDALPPLQQERAAALLHVLREGLSNIRRHASASTVFVALDASDGILQFELRDDGAGFDPEVQSGQSHRGIRNMTARAQRLGGTFVLESAPGAGTTLRVRMPVAS